MREVEKKVPIQIACVGLLWIAKGLGLFYLLYAYQADIFPLATQNELLGAVTLATILIAATAVISGIFLFWLQLWARNLILFLMALAEFGIIAKIAYDFTEGIATNMFLNLRIFLAVTFICIVYYFILNQKHFQRH